MKRLSRAQNVYLIYSGVTAFIFIMMKTVRELYRFDIAHFNAFQLVIVGTTLEVTGLLFEIPTGIIADKYSRKLSVIIGLFLVGISFIIEGLFPIFAVILICQIILGLGNTFTSGADEAWIADECPGEDLEHLFLKGAQIGQVFSIFGILSAIALGLIHLNLPFIIGGVLYFIIGLFLILFMKEHLFVKPTTNLTPLHHMVESIKSVILLIKTKPVLLLMVLISLFYGLFSEGFDRFWTPHFVTDYTLPHISNFNQNEQHVFIIGLINLSAMVLSIIAVEYIKRKLKKTGKLEKIWLLFLINLLMVITLFGFALTGQFYMAFSLYISFYMLRKINTPVYRAWMNQHIDSKIRATVLSSYGQIDSFGQIIGGPILGIIANYTSYSLGIILSALLLTPVIFFYLLFIRKIKNNQDFNY